VVRALVGSTGRGFNTRALYLKKVAELATQVFVEHDRCIVNGIILAGAAELKEHLQKHMFDVRVREKLLHTVDISYGGLAGFHQAISLCEEFLGSIRYVEESRLLSRYFDEIASGSDRIAYGTNVTLHALELSCVDTLLVWEDSKIFRHTFITPEGECIKFSSEPASNFLKSGWNLESSIPLVDWLVGLDCCDDFEDPEQFARVMEARLKGATLELVSDGSSLGKQFALGFGGRGALLRYAPPELFDDPELDDQENEDEPF